MTDDINTIRLGVDSDKRALAALARVEARLAAPCQCDKCLDCLAADGYEAAIEHAEQARAEADRLRKALGEIRFLLHTRRTGIHMDGTSQYPTPILAEIAAITEAALAGPQTKEQT